jgi:stearoyl-CoA desaturase (delta-9 desaturase)
MCFVLPTVIPWYFWGESLWNAFFVCGILRLVFVLNITWCVNSAAHMWGNKPYDRRINPVENFFVAFGAVGEGFHNYHHTFPMDYNASEFGWHINITSLIIDFMALIGQVYDRKKMSPELITHRKNKTGDGSEGFGVLEPPKMK